MTTLTLLNTTQLSLRADTPTGSVRLEPGEKKSVSFPVGKNACLKIAPIKAWRFHLFRHAFFSFWEEFWVDGIFGLFATLLNKPPVRLMLTATVELHLTAPATYQIASDCEYRDDAGAEILVPSLLGIASRDVTLPEWREIQRKLKRRLVLQEVFRAALMLGILLAVWQLLWAQNPTVAVEACALALLIIVLPVEFFSIRHSLRLYRTLTARFGV